MATSPYGVPKYNPKVPMSPYLRVKIGDVMYDMTSPNFLESFSFERQFGGRGEYTITMSDIMDYNLESKLINILQEGKPSVSFQYGHAQGSRSPWYRGYLKNYQPTFNGNLTASFNITGLAEMEFGKILNRKYYLRDYGYRYSNLIKELCLAEGWKIKEPFILSDKTADESIEVVGKTAHYFIQYIISPKTFKNGNPTQFYSYCHSDGVKVILDSFDPLNPKPPKKEYNFVINGGNYGSVLEFTPNYEGTAFYGLNFEASRVDRVTNQFNMFKVDTSLKQYPLRTAYMGADSVEEFNHILQNKWIEETMMAFSNASLSIVGDPDINPTDTINIIPIRPDGRLHISGGTYRVMTVTDEISSGFTTSLTLMKLGEFVKELKDAYESGWGMS